MSESDIIAIFCKGMNFGASLCALFYICISCLFYFHYKRKIKKLDEELESLKPGSSSDARGDRAKDLGRDPTINKAFDY